jgi:hypothetical protein
MAESAIVFFLVKIKKERTILERKKNNNKLMNFETNRKYLY